MPTSLEPLWLVAIFALTLTALVLRPALRRISNWLTVSALGLGLTFQSVVGGWSGLAAALARVRHWVRGVVRPLADGRRGVAATSS